MSKLGFHAASDKRTGASDLESAGAPLAVMVDQNFIDECHQHNMIVAYRTQHSKMGEDNPSGFMDFALATMPSLATQWMNSLKPIWDLNPRADYYIINNEQDIGTLSDAEKLNSFFQTCMTIAESWGLKVGICSFSSGNPTDDNGLTLEQRWQPMLPAIKQCAQNGHVIILHAHCLNSSSMMDSGEHESLRHQRTLRYFASQGLYPKIVIGELSNGVGGVQPDLTNYMKNVEWWDTQVMTSPWSRQVIGGALYGFNAAETLSSAVSSLVTWITNNPTPPEVDMPRTQYKRIYVLIHPSLSGKGYYDVAEKHNNTAGPSADDAGLGDLVDKEVVVVNASLWGGDAAMQNFFNTYYPGTTYFSVVCNSPVDLDNYLNTLPK